MNKVQMKVFPDELCPGDVVVITGVVAEIHDGPPHLMVMQTVDTEHASMLRRRLDDGDDQHIVFYDVGIVAHRDTEPLADEPTEKFTEVRLSDGSTAIKVRDCGAGEKCWWWSGADMTLTWSQLTRKDAVPVFVERRAR